ncbi:MAG: sigma factor-like helix-turn-helix DNA-binding protein [Mobilicoccus sp.]|nr:sigma factor-like helix-turn-helix DNA-binding protein [Mobilicoccus sp.]
MKRGRGPRRSSASATLSRLRWRALGEKQRAIVLLRHVDGVSDTDIARAVGCSVSTVRSQSSRGLAHLRAALTEGSTP